MPNWCENNLILSHKDPEQIERVVKAFNENNLLSEFHPMPKDTADWWQWSIDNWGTKWEIGISRGTIERLSPTRVSMSFLSAWSPPVNWYDRMVELGFKVRADYKEYGIGFQGVYDERFGDECWDIHEMDSNIEEE
jgi:hypothetical protein